jgi:hypothetical protein
MANPLTEALLETAWAAGFFDGEGSVYANRIRDQYYLRIAVAGTDEEAIYRFHRAVGDKGKVHGPYVLPSRAHREKPVTYWRASSKEARLVLEMLDPFLSQHTRKKMANAFEKVTRKGRD